MQGKNREVSEMRNFLEVLDEEIRDQERLMRQADKVLAYAPKGYLKSRPRKDSIAFYQGGTHFGRTHEKNITGNQLLIKELFQKRVYQEIQHKAEKNLAALELLKEKYESNHILDILPTLSKGYRDAALLYDAGSGERRKSECIQQNFNPQYHIHETTCGLLVRSKSEVIIANALTGYGIPFMYEKPFPYPDARGFYFEPDFTFELPDNETVIWEHLGLLNDLEYCNRNAYKLNTYQQHGFLIGRNLLITQDDQKGNCSSAYIDQLIRERLLPYFERK